jgi:hypothetical protein
MTKRGNGEGSIFQRKADKKWVASITLDDGKRKVLYGKTKKEVTEKLIRVRREQLQGLLAINSKTMNGFWLMLKRRGKIKSSLRKPKMNQKAERKAMKTMTIREVECAYYAKMQWNIAVK